MADPPAATNPLTPVYKALWTILEAGDDFPDLVAVGNRLKNVDGHGTPLKHGAQAADFPAVYIELVSGLFVNDWTNSGAHVKKKFNIKAVTGNMQVDDVLYLEWAIFDAMSNWKSTLTALKWDEKVYVKHCAIGGDNENTTKERELTRSETGWATILSGEVWMYFSK